MANTTVAQQVLSVREARDALSPAVDSFRNGSSTPLIFGSHRKPEAVVISYEAYIQLVGFMDETLAGDQFRTMIQERSSVPESELLSSEEAAIKMGLDPDQMEVEFQARQEQRRQALESED